MTRNLIYIALFSIATIPSFAQSLLPVADGFTRDDRGDNFYGSIAAYSTVGKYLSGLKVRAKEGANDQRSAVLFYDLSSFREVISDARLRLYVNPTLTTEDDEWSVEFDLFFADFLLDESYLPTPNNLTLNTNVEMEHIKTFSISSNAVGGFKYINDDAITELVNRSISSPNADSTICLVIQKHIPGDDNQIVVFDNAAMSNPVRLLIDNGGFDYDGPSVEVNVGFAHQEFIGGGVSFGLYGGHYFSMSRANQLEVARMLGEECKLQFFKTYLGDYPSANSGKVDNFMNAAKDLRLYNPDLKIQVCLNDLPNVLEVGGDTDDNVKGVYDENIPDILDKVADYYFQILKYMHDNDVTVDEFDVVNERGLDFRTRKLFGPVVTRLKELIDDPTINTTGVPQPQIVGPSTWSATGPLKWIQDFQADYPESWDNIDIVSTHGYQNGNLANYRTVYDVAAGKPFYNNEQTGKIQDDEGTGANAIDDLARQFVGGEEPEYVSDVSIAMRMSDVINAGGNAFFVFQSNNPSGNNAALVKTPWNGSPGKSRIYDGARHLIGTQPTHTQRVFHNKRNLDEVRIVTTRKKGEDTVFVHLTNVWGNAHEVYITCTDQGKQLQFTGVKAWVSDEQHDYEVVMDEQFTNPESSMVFEVGPHSVNTIKIALDQQIVTSTLAVQEDNSYAAVYPVPASGKLHVTLHNRRRLNAIQLHSIDGLLYLDRGGLNVNEFTIDVSNFSKGLYIVTLTDNEGRYYHKKIRVD